MNAEKISESDAIAFQRDGFLVVKDLVTPEECDDMTAIAQLHLAELIAPIEFEVDVQYPGSPAVGDSHADTSRRLLQAYARDEKYRQWATDPRIKEILQPLFSDTTVQAGVAVSQCHHNCMMTKQPGYSSVTLWHQDNRYWAFDREDLISTWLALGDENKTNGCLRVIPGSHRMRVEPGRFDAALFLRPDLKENKALIGQAQRVELARGDVLFFHSKLFHAAGRNLSDRTKFSLVYTYHQINNYPIAGTRSARFPSIVL